MKSPFMLPTPRWSPPYGDRLKTQHEDDGSTIRKKILLRSPKEKILEGFVAARTEMVNLGRFDLS